MKAFILVFASTVMAAIEFVARLLFILFAVPLACGNCTAAEARQALDDTTKCTAAFTPCATASDATTRCNCYTSFFECTKTVKVCADIPTPGPTTELDKMKAIVACTSLTGCSPTDCQMFGSPNRNMTDIAKVCQSRACGAEHIKGGRDQFCFCVRDHIKCLDGHFGSLKDKCDATNALEGTYADLCPDLCAALPRITPRPQMASGGVSVSDAVQLMPTPLSLVLAIFATTVVLFLFLRSRLYFRG